MARDLEEVLMEHHRLVEGQWAAEMCRIANTAADEGDDVFVTLPNSEVPSERVPVTFWRMTVGLDGDGILVPRMPVKGQTGVALHMDTGEICLIY